MIYISFVKLSLLPELKLMQDLGNKLELVLDNAMWWNLTFSMSGRLCCLRATVCQMLHNTHSAKQQVSAHLEFWGNQWITIKTLVENLKLFFPLKVKRK